MMDAQKIMLLNSEKKIYLVLCHCFPLVTATVPQTNVICIVYKKLNYDRLIQYKSTRQYN